MEACESGLTHGTCFVARRLEVVAVAGLLWISWCAFGCGGIHFVCVFFSPVFFFFFERTRPAASMRPRCLIYLCTSNEARARERSNRAVFRLQAEKPLHTGVRTGCHYLISLSACLSVCMCNIRRFARAVPGRFPKTRDLWKRASMG